MEAERRDASGLWREINNLREFIRQQYKDVPNIEDGIRAADGNR